MIVLGGNEYAVGENTNWHMRNNTLKLKHAKTDIELLAIYDTSEQEIDTVLRDALDVASFFIAKNNLLEPTIRALEHLHTKISGTEDIQDIFTKSRLLDLISKIRTNIADKKTNAITHIIPGKFPCWCYIKKKEINKFIKDATPSTVREKIELLIQVEKAMSGFLNKVEQYYISEAKNIAIITHAL